MDQTLFLSLLGILLTVVLGLWGIYLTIRHRYPGRIIFVEEACLGLFDTLVKHFAELSIQFKNRPVEENLVLLKGAILNHGQKDITPEMVEEKLCAELPEGFSWLAANIVSSSPRVRAIANIISTRVVEFDLGLFRCGEHFRIEALVEVPGSGREADFAATLSSSLRFSHRIADTGVSISSVNRLIERELRPLQVGIFLVAAITLLLFFLFFDTSVPKPTIRLDGRVIEVRVVDSNSGFVDLLGVKENFHKRIATKDLDSVLIKPKAPPAWSFAVLIFGFILFPLGFSIMSNLSRRRVYKLLDLQHEPPRRRRYRSRSRSRPL